jgi:chromosome segregation ATPase
MMTTATEKPVKRHLNDLHFDHQEWLNRLRFYKDEIHIFERRLEDIVKRNTTQEVMAELEHFQNRYIREREMIDELRHDIKQHENFLERETSERPTAVDHRLFGDHGELRERMETFERLYGELKHELHRWLAHRM